jgi:hypothetical protein
MKRIPNLAAPIRLARVATPGFDRRAVARL